MAIDGENQYESPLDFVVEDLRPRGGAEELHSLACSNCCPSPGFEGFEKRLDIKFHPGFEPQGLRRISRAELDTILQAAECTIVAEMSTTELDSYVLSESSLFIYPNRIVMKTCGTTQLLQSLPLILESANRLKLRVSHVMYTRGDFMFPDAQLFPHRSFTEEVECLESYLSTLGGGGKGFVMGSEYPKWHIYTASDSAVETDHENVCTLEMCMTKLNRDSATKFVKNSGVKSCGGELGRDMTKAAKIDSDLLPQSQICEFAFDPCGYSMNGIEGKAHSTIHVTPEEGFSYASFEAMGLQVDLPMLVENAVGLFKPAVFSVAVHGAMAATMWSFSVCPQGYVCGGRNQQELPNGSIVVFHTF